MLSDCGLDATKFLHGEHDITYNRPLRPGDRIRYFLEVVDVQEKHGRRSGRMDKYRKALAGRRPSTALPTAVGPITRQRARRPRRPAANRNSDDRYI